MYSDLQIKDREMNESENLTQYEYIEDEEEIIDILPESMYDSFLTIKELCNAVNNPYL